MEASATAKFMRVSPRKARLAIANAGQTGVIDVGTLYVKSACVNVGASQKRFRPAPMGRAHKYKRRTSHITIVVDEA
ncbi:MAG: ribosomal protein [Deltaproteobacteria bacterium]|nr:ribosomal protein [Deltaproteobacteria bacterium]